MSKVIKKIPLKTIRVKSKNLRAYEKTKSGWKLTKTEFPHLLEVVKSYKLAKRFKELIDGNNPVFLKGSWFNGEKGARINILPTGEKLNKAFSLFSPHLTIHDQKSHDHWDVIYQNKGGTWSYLYTLEKKKTHQTAKYRKVVEFGKKYNNLIKKVKRDLLENNSLAVPMYTLLKTHMRVGKETYFKTHGHKGLSTLTKENIRIKNKVVTFEYIGKDGVPNQISHKFPKKYIEQLNSLLKLKKKDEFIFPNLEKAFFNYCGHEFYPHIVRSYYATMKVKKFLEGHRKFSSEEIKKLFLSIAHELGHKKFDKKDGKWHEHYVVTVNSYIQPELVEKVQQKVSN